MIMKWNFSVNHCGKISFICTKNEYTSLWFCLIMCRVTGNNSDSLYSNSTKISKKGFFNSKVSNNYLFEITNKW